MSHSRPDFQGSQTPQKTKKEIFWQSLSKFSDTPETDRPADASVKSLARKPLHWMNRREFMGWMSALTAVMATSCTRQPNETIVPYAKQPEGLIPGKPQHYATMLEAASDVQPALVESHMGRPTFIAPHGDVPTAGGGIDRFVQSSLLDLYDPDRLQKPQHKKVSSEWGAYLKAIQKELEKQSATQGAGLRFVSPPVHSLVEKSLIEKVFKKYPKAKWYVDEPAYVGHSREATERAFGKKFDVVLDVKKADVIVSFDSDFLDLGPGHVSYSKQFTSRRSAESGQKSWNRLYSIANTPSVTSSSADHHWSVGTFELERLLVLLAKELGVSGLPEVSVGSSVWEKRIKEIAKDLKSSQSLVLVGPYQKAWAQALGYAINQKLGNIGKTISFITPRDALRTQKQSEYGLTGLVKELKAGRVEMLISYKTNFLYEHPHEGLEGLVKKVPFSTQVTSHLNESSDLYHWVLPLSHNLESWSDSILHSGVVGIRQPLIAPLYQTKTLSHVLSAVLAEYKTDHQVLKDYWKTQGISGVAWSRALHEGYIAKKGLKSVTATASPSVSVQWTQKQKTSKGALELIIRPDAHVYDGTFSNNGWLQELPQPLTKLTWENVVEISPAYAEANGIKNGHVLELKVGNQKVQAPAWVLPGQAATVATVVWGTEEPRQVEWAISSVLMFIN